ncbi:Isoprenylcysteine carboxyl methyltransferase family-domain-containing protein [Lipomyces arxii]|uniref:Isoprenylcysteine carboxyl methyltransferase family-domain-containing protein n=1 Tax=Lipomyces arxii TaxID=56418 RepID=UPI0034CE8473
MTQSSTTSAISATSTSQISVPKTLSSNSNSMASEIDAHNALGDNAIRRRQQGNEQRREAVLKEMNERYVYNYVHHQPDKVALYSAALAMVFVLALGATVWLYRSGSYFQLPLYISSLAAFHFMEYWITARYNPAKASIDSFLFHNGRSYNLAHASAIIEAVIEWTFCGSLKKYRLLTTLGLGLVVIGQVLRSMAMIHAASNFSHMIAHTKTESHKLVTSGVYAYTRHPSYLGYFYWAVGTQILLLNPVATIAFCVVLWRFFSSRIDYEEKYLIEFFGNKYTDYKKSTGTLIPFIP